MWAIKSVNCTQFKEILTSMSKSFEICNSVRLLETIEFFQDEFHWIQQIHNKKLYDCQRSYPSGTNTLPAIVIQSAFLLLSLVDFYYHSHQWTYTNADIVIEISFFTTTSRDVSIVRYGVSLVTILLWILSKNEI